MTSVPTSTPEPTRWWRRPRPPLTGFLAVQTSYVSGKYAAFFGLGFACLWGLGASAESWPWWGRALSAAVAVAGFTGIVVLAAYLHRPVSDGWADDVADAWARELARTGRVDIGVRPGSATLVLVFSTVLTATCGIVAVTGDSAPVKVFGAAGVVVILLLGFLPHLEFATGRGPGLRVDTQGITIARWVPLHIPWSEVVAVRTFRRMQAVAHTTDRFAAEYQASRPLLLRLTGGGPGLPGPDGFAIPSTVAAHPEALSAWLTDEVARRRQRA